MEEKQLKWGDSGASVREAARLLRSLHYPLSGVVDSFDKTMRRGVMAFQNDHNLPVTGSIDAATWSVLEAAGQPNTVGTDVAEAPPPPKSPFALTEPDWPGQSDVPMDTMPDASPSNPEEHQRRSGDDDSAQVFPDVHQPDAPEFPQIAPPWSMLPPSERPEQPDTVTLPQPDPYIIENGQIEKASPGDRRLNGTQTDPIPSLPEASRRLELGQTGEQVYTLQTHLKRHQCYDGVLDGVFGLSTGAAVRQFQKNNGLMADGIVNEKAWSFLENETQSCPAPGTPPEPPSQAEEQSQAEGRSPSETPSTPEMKVTPLPDADEFSPGVLSSPVSKNAQRTPLKEGDRGDEVMLCQHKLRRTGHFAKVVDGVFDRSTRSAVQLLQKEHDLPASGHMDVATWTALEALEERAAPADLREGDTGAEVQSLQKRLKALGFFPGTVTGSFGPETTTEVKAFQWVNNLEADGVVGEQTRLWLNR